jgi:hypothetical protein
VKRWTDLLAWDGERLPDDELSYGNRLSRLNADAAAREEERRVAYAPCATAIRIPRLSTMAQLQLVEQVCM